MLATTLDKFGRVLIPKSIREQLHLIPGDELEVEIEAQQILLRLKGPGEPTVTYADGIPIIQAIATTNATLRDVRGKSRVRR